MSEQEFRRADCGHYIASDHLPAGVSSDPHHQPIYLCDDCAERARRHGPRVQTKEIRPDALAARPNPAPRAAEFEAGRRAALADQPRMLPADLAGQHPRSAGPRAWFRGYDEAKSAAQG